jgi:hypothetical protein
MNKLVSIMIGLILSLTCFSQSCLPDGILFTNQNQIDSFQVNYPNCTQIEGDVKIGGDIIDLNGLSLITHIGGSLTIQLTNVLTNLIGLTSLSSIGENLFIAQNSSLTSLSGVPSLSNIGWGFEITANDALINLSGLEGLTSIGGSIRIDENYALTSLTGLDNIVASSISSLYIYDNIALSSCDAQSICDFLASPNGSVNIYENATGCNSPPEIANGCGITLPCLPYGNYHFSSQADITNFESDYPGCTDLLGYVVISGGDINNLNGLSVVDSIGSSLCLSGNPILSSLLGLDNIVAGSISDLYIYYNPSLSYCDVKSICDYLATPNGDVYIFYNATGCNSPEEIEADCGVGFEEKGEVSSHIIIYPNPATTIITIEITELSNISDLTILNLNGQELDHCHIMGPRTAIDISHLAAGVYFVNYKSENEVRMFKVVKY